MKSTYETYTISMIIDALEDNRVDLDHFLQREAGQWSTRQQNRLIDTLINGYPMPPIYAIKENDESNVLTILDGKQRISAIKAFCVDELFAYKFNESVQIDGISYDLKGLKYSQFPKNVQRKIMGSNFTVVSFTGYTVNDVLEIFERLNDGTPLSKAEKSKPLMGEKMILRLKSIVESGVFENTGLKESQLRKGEGYTILLQCLMLLKMQDIEGFSSSKIAKFIIDIRDNLTEEDYDILEALLDEFKKLTDQMEFGDKTNPITKTSIAPVVYALSKVYTDKERLMNFVSKLKGFFEHYSEQSEYLTYCSKTTDKSQVIGRVNVFLALTE